MRYVSDRDEFSNARSRPWRAATVLPEGPIVTLKREFRNELPVRHLLLLAALTPLILTLEPSNLHAQTAKDRRGVLPRTSLKRKR